MIEHLSVPEARKLMLLSQHLPPLSRHSGGAGKTLKAIEHLGYIQIDTIAAVRRAHHHTLWNRNPSYREEHLDTLLAQKKIFEHWSHAAAYLPMQDFRFSLPRKRDLLQAKENHWYVRDHELMGHIKERIAAEGPLMAKDLEHTRKRTDAWSASPVRQALNNLYMAGELMIPYRKNFQKVYDLTERVLPETVDTSIPDDEEYGRFLIRQFLRAHGIGNAAEITYLRKGLKPLITKTMDEMLESGELIEIKTGGRTYVALPNALSLLEPGIIRKKLIILSPFDNLIIQRKRIRDLFGFDYQLECYFPKAKRTYGYFALPLLWDVRFVGRIDCYVDRQGSVLHVNLLSLEEYPVKKIDKFLPAFEKALVSFASFNLTSHIEIHQIRLSKKQNGVESCIYERLKSLEL